MVERKDSAFRSCMNVMEMTEVCRMFAGVGAQAACASWDQVSVLDSCEVIAERRDMEKPDVWFESSLRSMESLLLRDGKHR